MVSKVYVIGMGMGNPDTLTVAARSALDRSDLIIGSSRLLEALGERDARMVALVASARIVEELREAPEAVASVVMSGDVGFYSGATSLYPLLEGWDVEVKLYAPRNGSKLFRGVLCGYDDDGNIVVAQGEERIAFKPEEIGKISTYFDFSNS
jgi:hypothetical protein